MIPRGFFSAGAPSEAGSSPYSKIERPQRSLFRSIFGSHFSVRSEEHTSELQSRLHLVCRLLLEKKKKKYRLPSHSRSFEKLTARSAQSAILLCLVEPLR